LISHTRPPVADLVHNEKHLEVKTFISYKDFNILTIFSILSVFNRVEWLLLNKA